MAFSNSFFRWQSAFRDSLGVGGFAPSVGSASDLLLELDFTTTSQPSALDSYSRASVCAPITGSGASGVEVTKFTSGQYAYAYDANFSHGSKLGMLVEPAATNLIPYSEEFDNAAWSKTGCTVNANAATAPDGTATADEIVYSGTTRVIGDAVTVTSGIDYVHSVFLRSPSGATTVDIRDTLTGTSTTVNLTTEWQRFEQTFTTASTTASLHIYSFSNQTIEAWGAQLEEGTVATSYIPTSGATASRVKTVAEVTNAYTNGYILHTAGEIQMTSVRRIAGGASFRFGGANDEKYLLATSGRLVDGSGSPHSTISPTAATLNTEVEEKLQWVDTGDLSTGTNNVRVTREGTGYAGSSGDFTAGTTNAELEIGHYLNVLQLNGVISVFRVYNQEQV